MKHAQTLRMFFIICYQQDAVAGGAKVFRWIETQAANRTHRAGAAISIFGADRLGHVFNNWDAMPVGNLEQRIHVDALTIKVDSDNGLRPWKYRPLNSGNIKVEGALVDIDKYWSRSQPSNR